MDHQALGLWKQDAISELLSSIKDFIVNRPIVLVSATAVLGYIAWYRLSAVKKPTIHCKEGKLRDFLLDTCPILSQPYWPTWWAVNCHVSTVFRTFVQKKLKHIKYDRHKITLPDGGVIQLDFGSNHDFTSNTPILLVLPGLTGDSFMDYVLLFVQDAYNSGYRPVIFNQRGTGGIPLETARLYAATNTEDLEFVIEYIRSLYPQAKMVAIGVSLGGIILSQYVSRSGHECLLSASITVSTPLHPPSSQYSLEKKWFNKKVYIDNMLVKNMLAIVKKNSHVIKRHPSIDFKRISRINSMSEFDAVITAPTFGYVNVAEYYAEASMVDKICRITIPYIALVAVDDPFIPIKQFPIEKFEENSNTFLILTKHGGHFGFLEGTIPSGASYLDRVNQQLLTSLKVFCKM